MVPVTRPARRLPWRAWLIYVHRWLGIAGCLLFLAWFVSGIVMIYARMPAVTPAERLGHLSPLDAAAIAVAPAEAARRAAAPTAVGARLEMMGGRPVYRFPGARMATVFADTGEVLDRVDPAAALARAREWAGAAAAPRYDALLAVPDQWTLQTRQHLPLHRIALDAAGDAQVYVSSRTGEVVMDTVRGERFWAYWGPVLHWLYLPVLRRNGPLWTQVIIWSSALGCVMCVVGLVVGLLRFSPAARFRLKGAQARSPYAGMMRWHHYAGLIFGLVTFTWTFSGLLSMGPFAWLSSGRLTAAERQVVTGAAPPLDAVTVPRVRAAVAALRRDGAPRELTLVAFRGEAFWASEEPPAAAAARSRTPVAAIERRLIAAAEPERGPFARFDAAVMEQTARAVLSGAPVDDLTWLHEYDAYYYDRLGTRPLPVLRVRYGDPQRTWLYLDPSTGGIALMSRPAGRANRWLYQGLHSLDLPALYYRRPLWDLVVIGLSLGGIALGVTSLSPAWRRLRRHGRRAASRLSGAPAPPVHRPEPSAEFRFVKGE